MGTMTETVATGPSAGVKKVGVVGGGTMGNGIAQVFAPPVSTSSWWT